MKRRKFVKSVGALSAAAYTYPNKIIDETSSLFYHGKLLEAPSVFFDQDISNSGGPEDGPNQPMGRPQGVKPGYVVWAWNPAATNPDCKNVIENNNWYFNPENFDQKIINGMFAESIRELTGEKDLKKAWDLIFRYHNKRKHNTDRGYTAGEKIYIKINQGTSDWLLSREDKNNGYFVPSYPVKPGTRTRGYGAMETGPYIVPELLRELVNECGINQADISIGDPHKHIFGHNYTYWHREFPNVRYTDRYSEDFNRTVVRETENVLLFYSDKTQDDKLFDVIEEADYMINLANFKPHGSAGITLTAKNHFGSIAGRAARLHYSNVAPSWETSPRQVGNPNNRGYRKYRAMVDLMGSKYLGRNTMLYIIDGMFGGGSDETRGPVKYLMPPFNNHWSSSIFMSLDQVALESVCFDFLRTEWDGVNKHDPANAIWEWVPNMPGVDDYLHQTADSKNWPEGLIYDPDNSGIPLPSLGVHEHWNNPTDMQYSGNLGKPNGITLVSVGDYIVKRV
ncbi:MAG TPA: DUF362 domain-containing protein [Bacteroidales bacterium]|jgi:hypothetical protein|nr:DUF362 domain-containing protein [Bacteroidales bacterium]HQH23659.1 DUF362 domain-containing protein [Bacteroidales bacterium]HQJ81181.1 DUF362 domain-containing protein [Bacteroidales bacterium]